MSMREHPACPHCGQRMMYMRAGARLPPLKARIFDRVKRAGPDGIAGADIIESLALDIGANCLRAHVWQINQILERFESSARITGQRGRMFRLIDEKSKIALAKEKRI